MSAWVSDTVWGWAAVPWMLKTPKGRATLERVNIGLFKELLTIPAPVIVKKLPKRLKE